MIRRTALHLLVAIFIPAALHAQSLVFDRGVSNTSSQPVSWKDEKGFLADDFRIGKKGESWMIDRLRTWALLAPNVTMGDLYSKITLFGGLLDPINPKQPKPPDDCDCHGVIRPVKAVDLDPRKLSPANPDLKITRVGSAGGKQLFQIDFENVRWSVVGGADVQFGLQAANRQNAPAGARTWLASAVPGEPDHLRVFENSGKFQSSVASGDKPLRIGVQVWAHLLVEVGIRVRQSGLEVIVKGTPTFDVSQVDRRTVRLGTGTGELARLEDADTDGRLDLVFSISRQAAGIPPNAATVCATGIRLDGVAFEGCNLVPR